MKSPRDLPRLLRTWKRIACALLLGAPLASPAAVAVDAYGWTVVTPSADSRLVYVSSSTGSDASDGLTPASPKATLEAANALIRDGYPDHLLLLRGDTFVANSATLYRWKNGRSADEPVLLGAYGGASARPVIKLTDRLIDHNGQTRNFQAYIGVDFYKSNSDPASADFTNVSATEGLRFVGGGANLLIEDCRLRFVGAVFQSYDTGRYTDIRFRRNIVVDTWVHNSANDGGRRIQGLFLSEVDGYTIEENFFDHNGWSEVIPGAGANMYNHNVYVQYDNEAGGIMRGNLFARGAAHGLQARSGGVVDRNLFVLNAVSLNVGGVAAPTHPEVLSFPNRAHDNVILNGRTMHPTDFDFPRTAALWGIWVPEFIPGVSVDGNIVANRVGDGANSAYVGVENMNFGENLSYQWDPSFDTSDPGWPHPDADLGDYYAAIGGTDSTLAYLAWQRERPAGQLPWNMTAYSAINYIREGFNQPKVQGYYGYAGNPAPIVTVSATDADAGEPSNHGSFTLTASPAPATPVTVTVAVSGTATNGQDYATIGQTVTIGTSGTATVPVLVTNDSTPELPETVVLTLSEGGEYVVGAQASAVVTLTDEDSVGMPVLKITASDAIAGEPADSGLFTLTATPAPSHPIQIDLAVSGTATSGQDYAKLPKKVKIGPGGTATIDLTVKEDTLIEEDETVIVTVEGGKKYLVDPSAASATVTIIDDTPEITVIAPDAAAGEPANGGSFAVVAEPAPASPITVNLTIGGTATNGTDYAALPTSVTIGTSGWAPLNVAVSDDAEIEGTETVAVTVAPGTTYTLGEPATAEVSIADDDGALPAPWVSHDIGAVAIPGEAIHQSGTFTVSGSGADIWGGNDQLHFVHQPASGDCAITARVASIENTSTDAKAGVMIRSSLASNAQHLLMEIIPNNAAETIFRSTTPGNSDYISGGSATAPLWVRVVRSGNSFSAYRSADGANWTLVGTRTIAMPADVQIGLAVCSNDNTELCTAVFDNVSVTP